MQLCTCRECSKRESNSSDVLGRSLADTINPSYASALPSNMFVPMPGKVSVEAEAANATGDAEYSLLCGYQRHCCRGLEM